MTCSTNKSWTLISFAKNCVLNRDAYINGCVLKWEVIVHYTWGSVTTLHDFEGALGRPLDTFFWALTISWSRLLARVWSGPHCGWHSMHQNATWINHKDFGKDHVLIIKLAPSIDKGHILIWTLSFKDKVMSLRSKWNWELCSGGGVSNKFDDPPICWIPCGHSIH